MRGRIDKACQAPLALIAVETEVDCIKIYIDRFIRQWSDGLQNTRKRWHLLHEALACQLLLLARIRLVLPEGTPRPRYRQCLVDTAVRMFEEALEGPTTTHMTHRASIFTFAASLVIRFADRRDLVLRLALRLAGHADRPSVPTTRRDAGRQMLAMLCASQHAHAESPRNPDLSAMVASLAGEAETDSTTIPESVNTSAASGNATAPTMESLMASMDYFSDIFDLSNGPLDNNFMATNTYLAGPGLGLNGDPRGGAGQVDSAGLSMSTGDRAYMSEQTWDSLTGNSGARLETGQLPFCELTTPLSRARANEDSFG